MTVLSDAKSVDKAIEIVDGTAKIGETNKVNPAFDDNIKDIDKDTDDDMPEIELDDIDEGDKKETGEEKEDDSEDKDQEEDSEEMEDDPDADDEDDSDESDNRDDKKEIDPDKNIEIDRQYKKVQTDLQQLTKQMGYINTRYGAVKEPDKPKADEYGEVSESDQRRYEIRLAANEDRKEGLAAEMDVLRDKIKDTAKEQEDYFREVHKGEKLVDFESFVRDRQHYYIAYLSGDSTLEELYEVYQLKHGKPKAKKDKAKAQTKAGVKIKRVDTTSKASSIKGGNNMPSKYKYSNLPAFKDYVKDLKARKRDIAGKLLTNERIEKLCKQEYREMKGISHV